MASKEDSGEEIETSKEAADQGKEILISLVNKLIAVAQEYEKKSGKPEQKLTMKDVLETLSGEGTQAAPGKEKGGKSNMIQVFSDKLSLTEKLQFSKGWASSSNAERMIEGFYESSKPHWQKIQDEDDKFFLGDVHLFKDIPESGALVIKEFWNKEGLLTKENKALVFKHFKDMIYYASLWKEIEQEEREKEGDSESYD
jgi:hypothetical protein